MQARHRLAAALLACLRRHGVLQSERPLLLAASGGADSTALALGCGMLREEGHLRGVLVLACIDHRQHRRGEAALQRVRSLGADLGALVDARQLDVAPQSSEVVLRRARYEALTALAREHGAGVVLTGHHADDQIETVLMRILRGSGVRGLGGIPEQRVLGEGVLLLRPLLGMRRAELRAALGECGDRGWFVEDPTNTDLRIHRNKIRAVELPRLRAEHGEGFADALLARAADRRRRAEALTAAAERWLVSHASIARHARGELDPALPAQPRLRGEILRLAHLAATASAPTRSWVRRALRLPESATGTLLCASAALDLERARHAIVLLPAAARAIQSGAVALDPGAVQSPFGASGFILCAQAPSGRAVLPATGTADRMRCVFDADRAPPPWSLRVARSDDAFDQQGMPAPIRVLEHMKRRGIGRLDRPRLPLVVDARDRVVWAPGLDVAAYARIDASTRQTIAIEATLLSGSPAQPPPY